MCVCFDDPWGFSYPDSLYKPDKIDKYVLIGYLLICIQQKEFKVLNLNKLRIFHGKLKFQSGIFSGDQTPEMVYNFSLQAEYMAIISTYSACSGTRHTS